jgi:RimJ/RimL family protein N-acetyltransferase
MGRWCIRETAPADRAALVKYANNPKVAANLRDRFPSPYTDADARLWLTSVAGETPRTHFAIADESELIGGIGLELKGDVYRQSAEIGYWLGEPHWGRGIATLALRALTEWGFRELGLARIYAGVFETNPASARVLEKAGYVFEGRLRRHVTKGGRLLDELIYSALR